MTDTLRSSHGQVVDTAYGPVRGFDDGKVKAWLGIRYAKAPVGELRWRAPEPPSQWREVADATAVGQVCPQPTDPKIPLDLGGQQGEDSLVLNIWAPSASEPGDRKPVMVWAHGGAYVLGSANQPLYQGRVLASEGDVVVVTVNYRLGAFGFLDLSAFSSATGLRFDTNLGLRDVLFALQWVRDNIAAFGGDPGRVTLFGESAGGGIVTTLLASPAAEGLFSAAIAQSSPATSIYDAERSRGVAGQVLDRLKIEPDDIGRLGDAPLGAILAASKAVFNAVPADTPGTLAFTPVVDGDLVPDYPVKLAREGRTHPVPLIIGTNKHEAALFRWMKSPLMPITPEAIRAMFEQIAAEQPGLRLPSEADIRWAYSGLRTKAIGMGVARDVGFRMPSLWFADGSNYPGTANMRRGCCGWTPRMPQNCPTYGAISLPDRRIRLSSWAGSSTAVRCRSGCATAGSPSRPLPSRRAPRENRSGARTAATTAPPWSSTSRTRSSPTWIAISTRRGAARCSTSADAQS